MKLRSAVLAKNCATPKVSEWRHHSQGLKEWGEYVSQKWSTYVVPEREQAAQLAQLDSFRELQPGWDSYGAEPPSEAAMSNARRILRVLWESEAGSRIQISPSVEGGVGIVFKGANKKYADIECFNDGEMLAITSDGTPEPTVWSVDSSADSLRAAIARVTLFLND